MAFLYPLTVNLTQHPACVASLADQSGLGRANSRLTKRQTKHVCIDAQTCGRVANITGMVNQRGDSIIANRVILGLVLKYLNEERFVIR